MRLHIGSGDKYWPGFVNVDMISGDIQSDVRKLIFDDKSAQEIHAIHLFEHIHRMDAEGALSEWKRVLCPGGVLALELPCLDKIAGLLSSGVEDFTKTLFGLYGDVRLGRPEMLHQWCWSKKEIKQVLESVGFVDIEVVDPFFHYKDRDMRVIARKPIAEVK
jgi:ubiquinone/menaquinone biosynthesis C-methylase UbiE